MQTAEINLMKRRAVLAGLIIVASGFAPASRAQFTTVSSAPVYAPNGIYGSYGTYVAAPAAPSVTNSSTSFSTSATASALGGFPNAGAIIGGPPPAVGNTFSVPNFTPAPPQTNAMTGVPFQPGSRGFIMAVAGLRPNGTSAITPAEPNPATTPVLLPRQPAGPTIVYRRAAAGSVALMTRETDTEPIESYPVGAIVRRGAPAIAPPPIAVPPVPRTVPLVPAPVITEAVPPSAGSVVIHDFPPGAFLRK
jgi:hypothetical protein